jgi:hypothetical protein
MGTKETMRQETEDHNFEELLKHVGHDIVCVTYGIKGQEPANVAIECETCNEVLLDFDRPDREAKKK